MRILKEYQALNAKIPLKNSITLSLDAESSEALLHYIGDIVSDSSCKQALCMVAEEILQVLSANANETEAVSVSCSFHGYYYALIFEFTETALPLNTLNSAVKPDHTANGQPEFKLLPKLMNRVDLSVDAAREMMRLSVIKEKVYSRSGPKILLPITADITSAPVTDSLICDFAERHFLQKGLHADRFLIIPELMLDTFHAGELQIVFLKDGNGNCAGGIIWLNANGIILILTASVFTRNRDAAKLLLAAFEQQADFSHAAYVAARITDSKLIADYFTHEDEVYRFRPVEQQLMEKQIAYIKPDLKQLIQNAYTKFSSKPEIREIHYNLEYVHPHSVLCTRADIEASEAVLSLLWAGDDLYQNVMRHIAAFQENNISDIYFRLDLTNPEEAAMSDILQQCGFTAEYLWPSTGESHIIIFRYQNHSAFALKACKIEKVTRPLTQKVAPLVTSVYGDVYPSQYLYQPDMLWKQIRRRHIYPYLAMDTNDEAVGMVSLIKTQENPYLFEIGQLMVAPKHRGTSIVNQLIDFLRNFAITHMDFDAVVSESVTNHKLSQRSSVQGGFIDTALKLNMMSGEVFLQEALFRQIDRMTCVVSCIEQADEQFLVYLPEPYQEQIRFCFTGLKKRIFRPCSAATVFHTATEYDVNDSEVDTSSLLGVTVTGIGSDMLKTATQLDAFAAENALHCMQVYIPLNCAYNQLAVDAFRKNGFFFGGIMPYWMPESDALLMQKLYRSKPDWKSIKLFSKKIKTIAQMIQEDMALS